MIDERTIAMHSREAVTLLWQSRKYRQILRNEDNALKICFVPISINEVFYIIFDKQRETGVKELDTFSAIVEFIKLFENGALPYMVIRNTYENSFYEGAFKILSNDITFTNFSPEVVSMFKTNFRPCKNEELYNTCIKKYINKTSCLEYSVKRAMYDNIIKKEDDE